MNADKKSHAEHKVKKSNVSKPRQLRAPSKTTVAPSTRVFGSAKGQVVFKKGWDVPMTEQEVDQFIGAGDLGPDIRKLKKLMKTFGHHE
jgi:hypothetical protein